MLSQKQVALAVGADALMISDVNPRRAWMEIQLQDLGGVFTAELYIFLGETNTATGIHLKPGDSYEINADNPYHGRVFIYPYNTGTASVLVEEAEIGD